MRKIFYIIISVFMVLSFVGCGNESEVKNEVQSKTADKIENKTISAGKVLVVYYSASGNTKEAANLIASQTNADTFELIPKNPYTPEDLDWTDDNSRVVHEHNNPDDRNIELESVIVPNWENYDTVFVGYPIWWGIAAWPVDSFVKENDFSRKNVIPFCTSSSSDIGESGQLLADEAGTGNWLEGERFSSSSLESDIQEWLNEIGF